MTAGQRCPARLTATSESSTVAFDAKPSPLFGSVNLIVPALTSETSVPLSLVAVIDISVSMVGERLALAKSTLNFIVSQLQEGDELCVVTFGSSAQTVLPLLKMSSANKERAKNTVAAIEINGCTNLSAGLFLGVQEIAKSTKTNVQSVMLMTDGDANFGITSVFEIESALAKQLQKGTTVSTFGFGSSHNAAFLRAISDTGRGMYYYIKDERTIAMSFAECLGGVKSVAYRNATLYLKPSMRGAQIIKIMSDLKQTQKGATYKLQLGNLSGGEKRNIPFSFQVPTLLAPANASEVYFDIKLTFEADAGVQEMSCNLNVSRPGLEDCKDEKDTPEFTEIDEQRNRVRVAEVLKEAIRLGESGNLKEARSTLQTELDTLKASGSHRAASSFTASLITDVEDSLTLVKDEATFRSTGVKHLYSLSRSHYQQRASGISSSAAASYLTEGQRDMLQALTGKTIGPQTPKAPLSVVTPASTVPIPTQSEPVKAKKKSRLLPPTTQPPAKMVALPIQAPVSVPEPLAEEKKEDQGRLARGIRRLIADLEEIKRNPLPSVTAEPVESDLFEWHCNMKGPELSPYQGTVFHFIMQFPHSYPFQPPKLFFCSYLKHENVFRAWICLDMLEEFEWSSKEQLDKPYSGWTTAYSVHSVLLQLQSFLFDKADTSRKEVQKASASASAFVCNGCPHSGAPKRAWPALDDKKIKQASFYSSLKISKAVIPPHAHRAKALPRLSHSSTTVSPLKINIEASQTDVADAVGWQTVQGRAKSGKKATEVDKMLIPTSNRFVPKVVVPTLGYAQHQSPPPSTIDLSEAVLTETKKVEDIEDLPNSTRTLSEKARKKNIKRRLKFKRIRLERERNAVPSPVPESKQRLEPVEELRLKTVSETLPSSLEEALQLQESKNGTIRGLQGSLFVFLPESLISKIFSFVDVQSLVRVSSACRAFYHIGNSESIWGDTRKRYLGSSAFKSVSNSKFSLAREVLVVRSQLFCFHTRKTFTEDTLGIPISFERNPRTRQIQYIHTTLDSLSREAFQEDKVRKSVWKRPFTHWLPLYISPQHFKRSQKNFGKTIAALCDATSYRPDMVLEVMPKLMNTMVVSVMSGETHASIVALEGYCAFHHILLKVMATNPSLVARVEGKVAEFIRHERSRTKNETPSLGDFIPLLAVSEKYSWEDVRSAYVQENLDRNALWVIKKFPRFRNPDRGYVQGSVNKDRLDKTFEANLTSLRLLMFHVHFLTKIVRPGKCSLSQVTSHYDLFLGRPTLQMKEDLQEHCKKILAVTSWPQFFAMIGMKPPSPAAVSFVLNQAVVNSKKKGYHN